MGILHPLILGTVLMAGALSPIAVSQTADTPVSNPNETTISGTVVSTSKNTLIVRTASNYHQLFIVDTDTAKPQDIPLGSQVTVISVSSSEPDMRLARRVTIAGESAERGQPTGEAGTAQQPPLVPVATRQLQRDIERHTRKVVFGFRGGIGMDPEVLLVGVHARIGPIFSRNIQFRPSAEFGFGEVTKLFGINLDTSYRLPITPYWSNWSMYVAAGPALGFSQQHFEKGNTGIDWGNLEFTPGLNIVTGLESRRGFLVEARATVYASPNPIFRVMFGYNF